MDMSGQDGRDMTEKGGVRMTPELLNTREVRCEDVHPVRCDVAFRASGDQALTDRVRAHGASAHGFTPADAPRHRAPRPVEPSLR
jgi:hypothetical protein